MKCVKVIKGNDFIKRISNEKAEKLVRSGQAKYVPKSAWKTQKQIKRELK